MAGKWPVIRRDVEYAAIRSALEEEIYSCAMQFEQIGALPAAADAAAQAAVGFQPHGDRRHTMEATAAADRLGAECGGRRTPALMLAANPLPLSTREREVANPVAAGLSDRVIADRLTVSTRTVDGHIYRACIKRRRDRETLAELIRGMHDKSC